MKLYSLKTPEFLELDYNEALYNLYSVLNNSYVFDIFVERVLKSFDKLDVGCHTSIHIPLTLRKHIPKVIKEIDMLYPNSKRILTQDNDISLMILHRT